MTHGSLFSGIGGFELAAEWMGWQNVFHCEKEPFGQRVLKHYWPQSKCYKDVTTADFRIWRGRVDVLSGGFPCQPYSSAGKRLGKEDDRHLWPHMLRAVREISPIWVVGENVRGLISWNDGLVFHEVQVDLESEGYEVQPFVLPACSVNAPHRRDRVFFCAYRTTTNPNHRFSKEQEEQIQARRHTFGFGSDRIATHSNGSRIRQDNRAGKSELIDEGDTVPNWHNFPTQSPICSGDDGISRQLDGITFSKWRNESIKAYGNAIVPQVALQIFKAIKQFETK